MSTSNHHHTSSTILPPISVFTSGSPLPPRPTNHATSSLMPASPPTGYDKHLKSLPILPKPQGEIYQEHAEPQSDQSTLWALFNEFQKQQKQQQNNAYQTKDHTTSLNRRYSDSNNHVLMLSSEEVLAEKRRRNAGASARFRDRRKQRERELQDKCHELEQRSKEFEKALRRLEPNHPLLTRASVASQCSSPVQYHASTDYQNLSDQNTLFDRVGQLEHLMTRFRKEKETDAQKLNELEQENKYLRSLLVPVNLTTTPKAADSGSSNASSPHIFATDEDQRSTCNRRRRSFEEDESSLSNCKRIHLSPSHNESSADDTHQQ